jgi:hypothetical protein
MVKTHAGCRAEPVLAAWGITSDGKPVFVALEAGGAESADAWADFLDGLKSVDLPTRCWSTPTAPPDSLRPSRPRSRARCARSA